MNETKRDMRPKPWRIVAGSGRWIIEDSTGVKVVETIFRSAADEIVQAVNARAGLSCPRCRGTGVYQVNDGGGHMDDSDCDECGGTGVAT